MELKTIEDIANNSELDITQLHYLLSEKLEELYEKEKDTNLFDYDQIRYSAMIDLIYDIMPSLKESTIGIK